MAKILLVEDDDMIRRMITMRLALRDHEIDTAEDGQEAIDKALVGDYDLILMDMHMPRKDGHQATRELREQGYSGTIVAVTASAMSADSEQAIQAGCDAHIAKPISADFENQIEAFLPPA